MTVVDTRRALGDGLDRQPRVLTSRCIRYTANPEIVQSGDRGQNAGRENLADFRTLRTHQDTAALPQVPASFSAERSRSLSAVRGWRDAMRPLSPALFHAPPGAAFSSPPTFVLSSTNLLGSLSANEVGMQCSRLDTQSICNRADRFDEFLLPRYEKCFRSPQKQYNRKVTA